MNNMFNPPDLRAWIADWSGKPFASAHIRMCRNDLYAELGRQHAGFHNHMINSYDDLVECISLIDEAWEQHRPPSPT